MKPLRLEIWSDIACPWCWVGKRHLEAALAELGADAEVHWRAFELDPSAPREVARDIDYVARLAAKYRVDRQQAQAMIDRMVAIGAEDGLDFRFDRIRPGNTFDAHRLMVLAAERGVQDALAERLFRAYLHEGRSVSDHGELAELGAEVGLDADEIQAVLASDAYAGEVRGEEMQAAKLSVSGVPFFVIENRYAIGGAQPVAVMRQVLERALSDSLVVVEGDADACGPDGCGVPSSSTDR